MKGKNFRGLQPYLLGEKSHSLLQQGLWGVGERKKGLEGQFRMVEKTPVGAYEVPCTLQGKMDSKEGKMK